MRLPQVTRMLNRFAGGELGITFIETVMALAILCIVAVTFLTGLATTSTATIIANEQATAESLVRSEAEYVKNCTYQHDAPTYPVSPSLNVPVGWAVPPPLVELVHATDDGLQKVTVTAEHNGEVILSTEIYKVDR